MRFSYRTERRYVTDGEESIVFKDLQLPFFFQSVPRKSLARYAGLSSKHTGCFIGLLLQVLASPCRCAKQVFFAVSTIPA